jgi:D-alanyl-D-alanine carboxypeptidase
MKRVLFFLALILCLAPTTVRAGILGPEKITRETDYPRDKGEFSAAIAVDVESGMILYEYEGLRAWPAASLTKLMSALVYLDNQAPDGTVVAMTSADEVGGGRLRIASGAKLTTQDLIYSSITASANNAAMALARLSGLGAKKFLGAMNAKAEAFEMRRTTFVDAAGIDPSNVTCARDLAKLAWRAFDNAWIKKSATTAQYRFKIRNTGEMKTIKTTNALLVDPQYNDVFVTGGKTGYLEESQYNLAVRLRPMEAVGNNDRHVLVVVLGAPSREASFVSAEALAKWVWEVYKW